VPAEIVGAGFNPSTDCDPNTDRPIARAAGCKPNGDPGSNTNSDTKHPYTDTKHPYSNTALAHSKSDS
jgi:hypothetical protein